MVLARGEVDVISGAWNSWRRRPDVLDGTFRPIIHPGLTGTRNCLTFP